MTWNALEGADPYDNEWLTKSIKKNVDIWKKEVKGDIFDSGKRSLSPINIE